MQASEHSTKKWLILLPILLGVGVLVLLVNTRPEPEQAPAVEQARAVRFIEIPAASVLPRALGYGSVKPSKVWEAVAEVAGKVIELNPQLKKGAILRKDSLAVRIDPADYELALAQTEADIQSSQTQLAEQDVKEANTRASLEIEVEALRLNEKEVERKKRLAAQGTLSSSEFEEQQRSFLAQKQSVQAQRNTINLIPVERRLLQAQLARYETQRASAQLNLERTQIRLPFDGRVAEMNVERSEYVRQGDVLAVIDGIQTAEVDAQVPITRLRALIQRQESLPIDLGPETVRKVLGLSAKVRLVDLQVEWDAQVTRVSDTIDPQTRTVGVIVEVDEPYRQAKPGIRPPLTKGMFVEVEFRGRPQTEALVLPRSALHESQVYLVNSDNRLEIRTVEVDLVQPHFLTVNSGLELGDRVVVSDLIPAIDGMLLEPLEDKESLARLLQQAQGHDDES
jgi:RND family efflux transporter MFP subunit